MKFEVLKDSKVISLQAETQAEVLQLRAVQHELKEKGVAHGTWSDMQGNSGLTLFCLSEEELVKKRK